MISTYSIHDATELEIGEVKKLELSDGRTIFVRSICIRTESGKATIEVFSDAKENIGVSL